jgi:hypothetical protein
MLPEVIAEYDLVARTSSDSPFPVRITICKPVQRARMADREPFDPEVFGVNLLPTEGEDRDA